MTTEPRTDSVPARASELAQAFMETPAYKAYKAAEEAFQQDASAQALLQDFQNQQRTYATFKQQGFPGLEEQEAKLRTAQDTLQANPAVQDLLRTQEALQREIGDVLNHISQEIGFPFAPPQSGCC